MAFACASGFAFAKEEIAVAVTHGTFGSHIGIAFHSAREGAQILHLRFHKDLHTEAFPPLWGCWLACVASIPKPASKQVVGIVRAVSKRRPQINFGINLIAGKGSFDQFGSYKAPKGSDGLTCATFVSEILRAAAVVLLKEETWPSDPDNVKWGEEVLELLKRKGASEEHIEAVRGNNKGLRVRPEEVGVAADTLASLRPIDFTAARAGMPAVLTTLESCCPKRAALSVATPPPLPLLTPPKQV